MSQSPAVLKLLRVKEAGALAVMLGLVLEEINEELQFGGLQTVGRQGVDGVPVACRAITMVARSVGEAAPRAAPLPVS